MGWEEKKEEEGNSGKGGWPNFQCHNNVCSAEESESQDWNAHGTEESRI